MVALFCAYSIPITVEHLKFETKAKFILAIETAGMFERLNKHGYWKKANCIIISILLLGAAAMMSPI